MSASVEQTPRLDGEEWRDVPGYEGLYLVSSLGRFYRLPRRMGGGDYRGRLLSQRHNRKGYLHVDLRSASGDVWTARAHRLVARAFLGEPRDGQEVRHLNGRRDDNRAVNLAWGTGSENSRDAIAHGTHTTARRTHCPQGHPYAGDNLYVRPCGRRRCRTCQREKRQKAANAASR